MYIFCVEQYCYRMKNLIELLKENDFIHDIYINVHLLKTNLLRYICIKKLKI